MNNFSVVVITFNEEKIIEKCISALENVSDDIVIIDSLSTDKTKEICQKLGAKVIDQKWLGYSAQKNVAVSYVKYDWILSIDADEILSDDFIENVKKINFSDKEIIYKISRYNNYCSQWIKYGRWYPEWRNRLFHKDFAKWNIDLVHEDLMQIEDENVDSFQFKKIQGNVYHYSIQSKEEHLEKVKIYSTLSAQKLLAKNKKATFEKRFLSPSFRFFMDYFVRLGFLDGKLGYQIASLGAYETFLKYKKLKALLKEKK